MRAIAKPHTHKIGLISGKNQGNLPPPPGTPEIPNIRWFNRENPRNPRKIEKNQEKMGSWWGVGGGREYRIPPQNTPEDSKKNATNFTVSYMLLNLYSSRFFSSLRGYFGVGSGTHYMYSRERGITPRPTIEMNEGTRIPSFGNHEKNCEAIYWKHHTSHLLTKISHTITIKTFFFTKNTILIENK